MSQIKIIVPVPIITDVQIRNESSLITDDLVLKDVLDLVLVLNLNPVLNPALGLGPVLILVAGPILNPVHNPVRQTLDGLVHCQLSQQSRLQSQALQHCINHHETGHLVVQTETLINGHANTAVLPREVVMGRSLDFVKSKRFLETWMIRTLKGVVRTVITIQVGLRAIKACILVEPF